MNSHYAELLEDYAAKPSEYYEIARLEMVPFVPRKSRMILDVGCSSGVFGAALKEVIRGCEVWGIEPDEKAAEVARERLDRVINSTFSVDTQELQGRQFDVICFNDVLEHLPNPEKVLTESRGYLSEKGTIVASLPNILHFYQIAKILIEQDWKYEESGIMDRTHLRFFTKKSIIRMFEETGYIIEEIAGINPSFGLKYQIANALALGRLADWRFVQFAVRARLAQ